MNQTPGSFEPVPPLGGHLSVGNSVPSWAVGGHLSPWTGLAGRGMGQVQPSDSCHPGR